MLYLSHFYSFICVYLQIPLLPSILYTGAPRHSVATTWSVSTDVCDCTGYHMTYGTKSYVACTYYMYGALFASRALASPDSIFTARDCLPPPHACLSPPALH